MDNNIEAGNMPPEQNSPASAPMSTPTQPAGLQQKAKANIGIAMMILENALPNLSDEDKPEVLKTLTTLHKRFGQSSTEEIMPAQLQNLYRQSKGGLPQGMLPQAAPAPAPNAGAVMPQ